MFNSPNNKTQIYGKTGSADRKTCLLNEEFYFSSIDFSFLFFLGGGEVRDELQMLQGSYRSVPDI